MGKIIKDEQIQDTEQTTPVTEQAEEKKEYPTPQFNKITVANLLSTRINILASHAENMRIQGDFNSATIEGRAISELAYILGEIGNYK